MYLSFSSIEEGVVVVSENKITSLPGIYMLLLSSVFILRATVPYNILLPIIAFRAAGCCFSDRFVALRNPAYWQMWASPSSQLVVVVFRWEERNVCFTCSELLVLLDPERFSGSFSTFAISDAFTTVDGILARMYDCET